MRTLWAKQLASCVPTKVVQLITKLRHLNFADPLAVRARTGINIDNQQRVVEFAAGRIESRHERVLFRRSLHRQPRRWVKRWVWFQERHRTVLLGRYFFWYSFRCENSRVVCVIFREKQTIRRLSQELVVHLF